MLKTVLYTIGFACLIAVLLSVLLGVLVNEHDEEAPKPELLDLSCSLHEGACEIDLGSSKLSLSLNPRELPALTPLVLDVSLRGADLGLKAEDLVIWFEGRDMDMGRHYFQPKQSDNKKFSYAGMIPVCTVDANMVWLLSVELTRQDQPYRYRFNLRSVHE